MITEVCSLRYTSSTSANDRQSIHDRSPQIHEQLTPTTQRHGNSLDPERLGQVLEEVSMWVCLISRSRPISMHMDTHRLLDAYHIQTVCTALTLVPIVMIKHHFQLAFLARE